MIRNSYLITILAIGLFSCGTKAQVTSEGTVSTASTLPTAAPYLLEVTRATSQPTGMPGLHSMALGVWTDTTDNHEKWLLIGGRTNGFHGRSGPTSGFPQSMANTKMWVVDREGGTTHSMDIPTDWENFAQLKSTNMQSYQDGDLLMFVGGYGNTASEGPAEQTFSKALFINVPAMGKAVIDNDATSAKTAIVSEISNDVFQVTGGELDKIGDKYYLVFGQNYEGAYETSLNGTYTNSITELTFAGTPPTSVAVGSAFTYDDKPASEYTPYHRRDLNVHPAMIRGKKGAVAYAGVFTKEFGAWTNPVLMVLDSDNNSISVGMAEGFSQKANLYEAATVLMYDESTEQTFTSVLGGISDYVWNDTTNSIASSGNWPIEKQLPFSRVINTMVMNTLGTQFVEFIQDKDQGLLPGWLGANGYFIQNSAYAYDDDFLDWSKVKAAGDKVLIGYFIGGIQSQGPYTGDGITGTRANNSVYEVYAKPVN